MNQIQLSPDSRIGTLDMSSEAKKLIETVGDEIGAKYFRKDAFESIMRPSYFERDANSELPVTDISGKPILFTNQPEDTIFGKNHVYTLAPDHYDRIVLYIHGGAYVHNAADVHAQFCDLLATELNAKIVMPMYTLAPQGTWKDAYPLLHNIWDGLQKEGLPVFLMGDSAGGGLALGFAEELVENGEPMPQKMVLLSPWVDITLTNPAIAQFEASDISLAVYGLVECGKMWAGTLNVNDRHVNPLHYDHFEKLPDTLLFIGTAEIFHPDVVELYNKMIDAGVNAFLITGTGLYHVFPVYTSTPESKQSRDIIACFLLEQ